VKRSSMLRIQRFAGDVVRYHTWPTITQQTVADHSWNVLRIWWQLFGEPPIHIVQYIMFHDCGELVTGDLPFPFKARNPSIGEALAIAEELALEGMGLYIPELTRVEKEQVKVCDLAEMHEFGIKERMMGNKYAEPIIEDTHKALDTLLSTANWDSGLLARVRTKLRSNFENLVGKIEG
jgi:hypothetical protein